MKLSPVSFGSIMAFTINDGVPKTLVSDLVQTAFNSNPALKGYSVDTYEHDEEIDGTVYNAAKDFSKKLDEKYAPELPNGSKRVILTKADFYVNPIKKEPRYFITAATNNDEEKIHKILADGATFIVARFGKKK